METTSRILALGALAFVTLPAASVTTTWAQGAVLVVDAAGGAGSQYRTIAGAVLDAAAGDTVLVRSGSYERFTLEGKGLAIVADAGADVIVGLKTGGPTRIQDVPAGDVVLLRGIDFSNDSGWFTGATPPSLVVQRVDGTTWIEDCRIDEGYPSLLVEDCGSVTIARCLLEGGPCYLAGGFTHLPPGAALGSTSSVVRLSDSELVGNAGCGASEFPYGYAGPGSAGAELDGGALFAVRATFRGGDGGNGIEYSTMPGTCLPPAPGGPGLWLWSGDPLAHLVEVGAAGGTGGTDPCGDLAGDGPAFEIDAGSAVLLPGEPAGLVVEAPVREGQDLAATVSVTPTGLPGALAVLAFGLVPADTFVLALSGVVHVGAPLALVVLEPIPPSGEIVYTAVVPGLGPGAGSLLVYVQVASCTGTACWLGAPSTAVLLDSAY